MTSAAAKFRSANRRRNSCLQALEVAREEVLGVSLGDMLALLYVAENEGLNVKELSQLCRTTLATASRTARSLAAPGTRDALPPYAGLLETRINVHDRRGRTLHLTESGRALTSRIDTIIREAVPITNDAP